MTNLSKLSWIFKQNNRCWVIYRSFLTQSLRSFTNKASWKTWNKNGRKSSKSILSQQTKTKTRNWSNSITVISSSLIRLRNSCIFWMIGLMRICILKMAKKSSQKDRQEWVLKCSKTTKMPIKWKLSPRSANKRQIYKSLTFPKKNSSHVSRLLRTLRFRRSWKIFTPQ